jgi:5-methyltetrahydrofolate--homocysteine methyltransferase
VTVADKTAYDTDLLDTRSKRVMVGDEMLNEARPEAIETIHRNCFEAGADAVEAKYVRLQSG